LQTIERHLLLYFIFYVVFNSVDGAFELAPASTGKSTVIEWSSESSLLRRVVINRKNGLSYRGYLLSLLSRYRTFAPTVLYQIPCVASACVEDRYYPGLPR